MSDGKFQILKLQSIKIKIKTSPNFKGIIFNLLKKKNQLYYIHVYNLHFNVVIRTHINL